MMLVIIGKGWLSATDAAGKRRLDDPRDFVRQEVAAALKRNISVTPVLVQGASMPSADELPEDLQDLTYRNSFELSHNRWESDVNEMIRRLGLSKSNIGYWIGGSGIALAIVLLGLLALRQSTTQGTITDGPSTRAMGALESSSRRHGRGSIAQIILPVRSTRTAQECAALCEANTTCEAMSFRQDGEPVDNCYLTSTSVEQPIKADGYVSAKKQATSTYLRD